jgi:hypothetical protein
MHELSHEQRKRIIYALEFLERERTLETPAEVHHYALHYNWDNGSASMLRLLDHPALDAGTALLIYWRASPSFFAQATTREEVPVWARGTYDLVKAIEQRFLHQEWANSQICFDPQNDPAMGNLTEEAGMNADLAVIPPVMFQTTPGVALAWDELYDDLTDDELEQLEVDIAQDEANEQTSRHYHYVGPHDLRQLLEQPSDRTPIRQPDDVCAWMRAAHQKLTADQPITATFVIDTDGQLWIADRHSEHVACAAGRAVMAAGEITFAIDTRQIEVVEITNQSTGYCPEPESWTAVARTLAAISIAHPPDFTHLFLFRRCGKCGTINIIKEDVFECAVCEATLSRAWNLETAP